MRSSLTYCRHDNETRGNRGRCIIRLLFGICFCGGVGLWCCDCRMGIYVRCCLDCGVDFLGVFVVVGVGWGGLG
jgi:hypothetical protein